MTIKVCHITSAHDSDDVRIFQKECVSISENEKFKVYLVAHGESRLEKNVQVVGIGAKPSGRFKRMFSFTRRIYKTALKIDADIYHIHDPELLLYGYKLKRRGKHVVFDSHEYTYEQIKIKEYIPKLIRNLIAKVYLIVEGYVCKAIDGVVFPCTIGGVNPFENRSRKTIFINNVPSLKELNPASNNHKIYDVCHIGSLSEERGIRQLLEACKYADVSILLGGDFASESFRKNMIEEGLMDNVTYVGTCTRKQVIDYCNKSRIGASMILPVGQYPSADNLPTKVYEFMAMGLPVIISNLPYSSRMIEKYKFGIDVDPTEPLSVAMAIKHLLEDESLRKDMGDNGRRAIVKELNWENEIAKLIEFYMEITGERGR